MRKRTTLLAALWCAMALFIAGVLRDLDWHSTHGAAADGGDLLVGHGVAWLGTAWTVGVAIVGARLVASRWHAGYRLLLVVAVLHASTEAAHVAGHSTPGDTDALHVLLWVGRVAMVIAATSASAVTRRRRRDGHDAPGTGPATEQHPDSGVAEATETHLRADLPSQI